MFCLAILGCIMLSSEVASFNCICRDVGMNCVEIRSTQQCALLEVSEITEYNV